jgi:hypothetical protein
MSDFPRPVLSRDGRLTGEATGSFRRCQLAGCTGRQHFVKWPTGQRSWPCSKGIVENPDGIWRIA